MSIYGFDRMYDNSSSKVSEKVTKSEAIKMIISTVYNLYDISSFAPIEDAKYDNEIWVKYAEDKSILIEEIDEKNQDDKISYIDVVMLFSKAKSEILGLSLDIEGTPNFSDFDKYSNEEQTALKDIIWNKIIENNTEKLNGNRKIAKGELNELLINFAEKYNTITLGSEDKININEEKIPYNSDIYTYTLANVNKKIYEARFDYSNVSTSILPKDIYVKCKDYIPSWISIIEEYYNTLLNVDYNDFSKENFKETINAYSYNSYSNTSIDNYESYIKDNKISITGSVVPVMPIMYYDGQYLRMRVKLQYTILSSNTRKNILFGDLMSGIDVIYDEDSNIQYIDVKLATYDEDFKEVTVIKTVINDLAIEELK